MKVLILEDNKVKSAAIQQVLNDCCGHTGISVEVVSTALSGRDALKNNHFDLLILDLVLPLRNPGAVSADNGKMILDEILEGEVSIPTHIICVTAFESESGILADAIKNKLVHLVIYSEINDSWIPAMQAKIELIRRRLSQNTPDKMQPMADVVIITSSPLVELRAVYNLPGDFTAEYDHEDEIHYYLGEWTGSSGRKISVVACAAPSMGMTAACATTLKAIYRWRPRFVVMTGIAASTVSNQDLGDILCVETAYDYGSGKIVDSASGERTFLPSPKQIQLDPKVQEIAKFWERDQSWAREVASDWTKKKDVKVPTMHVGVMASGAAVVQSSTMVGTIKAQSRKTVGLDMECYGVFQACELAGSSRPVAIVAKSISDYADPGKSDDAHEFAAFTSARFAYFLLTRSDELWT